MRTACSSSHLLGVFGLETPRVGLEIPPIVDLDTFPRCGPGDPSPRPDPSTSPWVWAWRPARHAGIPPPLWTEWLTDRCKSYIQMAQIRITNKMQHPSIRKQHGFIAVTSPCDWNLVLCVSYLHGKCLYGCYCCLTSCYTEANIRRTDTVQIWTSIKYQ